MVNEENENIEQKAAVSGDAFNPTEMLRMAWRAKYWIILSVIVCVGLSAFWYKRQAKIYNANAEVLLLFGNEESSASANALRAISDISGVKPQSSVNFYNELEVMRSPSLLESVVERLNLSTYYTTEGFGHSIDLYGHSPVLVNFLDLHPDSTATFRLSKTAKGELIATNFYSNNKPKESKPLRIIPGTVVETPVGTLSISATATFDKFPVYVDVSKRSVKKMAEHLSKEMTATRKDEDNTVAVINYNDVSEQRAKDVVVTMIDSYQALWIAERTRSADNTSNFINERLAVIEKELSGIDSDITQVKSANQVADLATAANSYYGQTLSYDTRAFEANTQLQIAEYLRDYVTDSSNANAMIPANTGTNGAIEAQIQEYNKLLVRRDQLLENSTEANPVIAQMNIDLAKNRSLILSSLNNIISSHRIEVDRAQGRGRDYSGKISAVPKQEEKILSIERQQKVKENLYLYLLQKREENELNRMVEVNNTRIIRPVNTSIPNAGLIFKCGLVGLLLGLAIPASIIFIILKMDTKISRKSDLAGVSIPFLGEMPFSRNKRSFKKSLRNALHPHSREITDKELRLVVKERSRSYINEAFRMLRTNLDFMSHTTGGCETLMLTSFNPGSGKTFISINLAKSLSLKGKRVLLVDMDLRRLSLSNFAGNPTQGVSSFLTGMNDDVMSLVRVNNNNSGLDILPVGAVPPNPVELLLGDKFKEMLNTLRQHYDYIVLDCPPFNIVADTAIIAQEADVTLFVVRAGLFNKALLKELEATYKEKKLPNMALILNGINPKNSYYYGRYGYGYGYGHYGYAYGYTKADSTEDEPEDDGATADKQ